MQRSTFALMFPLLAAVSSLAVAQTPVNAPPALMNFQGRLAKPDGTPVADGNYALTLSIWDTKTVGQGTQRWGQTFSSVAVHNGTFALLLDLSTGFLNSNTLDSAINNNTYLQVQVGTNAPLSPRQQLVSTAYALKAGSVPDGSITVNKLDASLKNSVLGGAAGGDLIGAFPNPQIKTDASILTKVSGNLLVVPSTTYTTTLDQSQPTVTSLVTSSAWQSFTPSVSGTMVELDVYCGTSGASVATNLNIYLGEGNGTNPILTVPITVNPSTGLQAFPISLSVTAGTKYTWSIGTNNNLRFGYALTSYAGGDSNLGATYDYAFQTLMKATAGPTTQINAAANLYFTNQYAVLENAADGPMLVKQWSPFTSGPKNGYGRWGMWMEPNALFLGFPASDAGGATMRLGTWGLDGTRTDLMTLANTGTVTMNVPLNTGNVTTTGNHTISGKTTTTNLQVTSNALAGNVLVAVDNAGNIGYSNPAAALGAAGGDLVGTFPNPSLATKASSLAKVSGNALTSDGSNIGIGINSYLAQNPTDKFTVDSKSIGSYSLGWFNDSWNGFGGTAWLSGYGGIKLYTGNSTAPRIAVSQNGQIGINTTPTYGTLDVNGTVGIRGSNTLEFGAGVSGKEPSAGKIGYGTFDAGILDIVGGGTTGTNRQVKIYSEGGLTINGPVYGSSDINASGNINATNGSVSTINMYASNYIQSNSGIRAGNYISVGGSGNSSISSIEVGAGALNALQIYSNYNPGGIPTLYVENRGGGQAGYFKGYLSSSDKRFMIDDPIDPENKYLVHGCVESDERRNIYDGTVTLDANGEATIQMAKWFQALNKDCRYQLTCIGGYAQVYIASEMADNQFKIAGGKPGLKVSWQVTGVRQDAWAKANPMPNEQDKGEFRGQYLTPEAFGLPASRGGAMRPKLKNEPQENAKTAPGSKASDVKATVQNTDPTQAQNARIAQLEKQLAALLAVQQPKPTTTANAH